MYKQKFNPVSDTFDLVPKKGSIFTITGARNGNNSTDRDLKRGDVFFNQTPAIIPYDCTLIGITCATDGVETWEAHVYKNGSSITFIPVTAQDSAIIQGLNIDFSAGDEVRLRQENAVGNIARPAIKAYFELK